MRGTETSIPLRNATRESFVPSVFRVVYNPRRS
jgi:hypothetical protein